MFRRLPRSVPAAEFFDIGNGELRPLRRAPRPGGIYKHEWIRLNPTESDQIRAEIIIIFQKLIIESG